MKHIRAAMMGAMLVFGGAALAAAQQSTPTPTPQTQHSGKFMRGRGGFGGGERVLLKGITLSDAEKASLQNVRAKYRPQLQALRHQEKPQMEAARAARQRGDTAALRQIWQQDSPRREQAKQIMTAERNDMRNALTPANQARFDANVKILERRATKHGSRA